MCCGNVEMAAQGYSGECVETWKLGCWRHENVPLLVQQVSRTYIISPAVDHFAPDLPFLSYPKPQLEEQAVEKLRVFKAEIEFDALLRGDSIPTQEELQQNISNT